MQHNAVRLCDRTSILHQRGDLTLFGDQQAGQFVGLGGALWRPRCSHGVQIGADLVHPRDRLRRGGMGCGHRLRHQAIGVGEVASRAASTARADANCGPDSPSCSAMGTTVPRGGTTNNSLPGGARWLKLSADRHVLPHPAYLHGRPGMGCLHHEVAADGQLDMAGVRKDQVTGAHLGP